MLWPGWTGGLGGGQFYRLFEFFSCGGIARQPQCTEPCQCVSVQLWAYLGALQGQIQDLQCGAAGVLEPALGAVAWLGR